MLGQCLAVCVDFVFSVIKEVVKMISLDSQTHITV